MSRTVEVRAPSNIALIKYMGKLPEGGNLPENPSVSLTLNRLATNLRIEQSSTGKDEWKKNRAGDLPGETPDLSETGVARFLRFIDQLRNRFDVVRTPLQITSANTFPHSAGIASSASSFSALTLGFFAFHAGDDEKFRVRFSSREGKEFLSEVARSGSGSSCRSFEGPFVSWSGSFATKIASKFPKMSDLILVAGTEEKKVGSSEAHLRVKSSPLWEKRQAVIQKRFESLTEAISAGDFSTVAEISNLEFREMHELFHTAAEPFTYFNDRSRELLNTIDGAKAELRRRAIFTMDAGPNIHCLVPTSQKNEMREWWEKKHPGIMILEDDEGAGAEYSLVKS